MELNAQLERANSGSVIRVAVLVVLYFCLFSLGQKIEVCVSFSVILCFLSGKDLRKPRMQLMSQKACFPDFTTSFP